MRDQELSWQNHYDNMRGRILPMNGTVHCLSVIHEESFNYP
jgi:hypothetical protein